MADMRIGGLASGMDIDTIVSDLMKAERIPLDKLTQKKQILEWQRDDYREMNKLLKELDTSIFDGIGRQSTFIKKAVTSSNEAAVSVRSVNATTNVSSSIVVSQLARSAYMNSAGSAINAGETIDPNATLDSQRTKFVNDWGTANTFTIQGIQKDGTMGDPKTVTFDPASDSLNDVINKINQQTDVMAFFDETTGRISLNAKNTGDVSGNAEIIVSGAFANDTLRLHSTNEQAASTGIGRLGQNAEFSLNGLATTRASNTFTINGYEYTLKEATNTEISITAATDVDSIFESVVKFADKYNETIEKINKELSEERYRDYKPLSDKQKEDMSDKQVEMWEERARSGLLRSDTILSGGLNQMRLDMYSPVTGVNSDFNQLSEIGIKTSSNYLDRGKLIVDEGKLKEAIRKNPNAIFELFNVNGASHSQMGIADRLRASIDKTMDKIETRAGNQLKTNQQFTLGRQLSSVDKQIDRFEDRMIKIEDRYWRQFTAMEKAIQRSNEQAMMLMNSFGGGM
ncbi:flagellar hook-associated protein 2 [Bacillus marinisedimentorum]|uniref:flagellar hook-associated protein 2 n=1 Tax=Bacillus marinisedimentorum TaxID=1821260 RepID=UPI0007E0B71E|nr:flagellar hook-associated protein 2 [Bacillus marinisedimentorum]